MFAVAEAAYAQVGLPVNEDQKIRGQLGGIVLGAHVDADAWVAAPPPKALKLMTITSRVVRSGRTTFALGVTAWVLDL